MATTIVTKSGSGAPAASDLVAGELAVDLTNGRLYTEDSGGTVLELGLNPNGNVDVTGSVTSGAHLINAASTAFGASSVQGFNTDFLVDTGQGYARHNSYHTGGSNHQFLVNEASSTTNAVAFSIAKDKSATFYGSVTADGLIVSATYASDTTEQVRIEDNTGGKLDFFGYSNGGKGIQAYADDGSTFYNLNLNPLGGNVGIGTSSPDYTLDLGGAAPVIRIGDAGSIQPTLTRNNSTGGLTYNTTGQSITSLIEFKDNGVERMRIDSSGNVGIGTSSVATKLHVMGNSTVRNTIVSTLTLDAGTSASNPYTNFGTGIDFKGRDYSNAIRNYGGIYSIMVGNASSTTAAGDAGFKSALTFYTNTGGASGTNPTEKMRIDSSGNVGIGTSSPTAPLHVDAAGMGDIYSGLIENSTTDTDHYNVVRFIQGASGSATGFIGTGGSATGNPAFRNTFAVGTQSANSFVLATNDTERMRIDASGNLLVGKTATSFSSAGIGLMGNDQILATAASDNPLALNRLTTDGDIARFYKDSVQVGSIGVNDDKIIFGTANAAIAIDQSSNILFPYNPATPAARDAAIDLGYASGRFKDLHLSGTSNVGVGRFTAQNGTNSAASLVLGHEGSSKSQIRAYGINAGTIGSLEFMVSASDGTGNNSMTLDSSGNLLVGKTAGNSPAIIGFETQQDGEVYSTIATGYNTYHVYANSGYRFYVNPNGGLYNYSANNVNLSDEREKKNIELLESQWDSLKQWSLKKFHYNADAASDNKKLGVIAQEVATHNPEVIDEFNVDDDTTRLAVKEQQMMWMAIKALQEAQTRIESLEARIEALES